MQTFFNLTKLLMQDGLVVALFGILFGRASMSQLSLNAISVFSPRKYRCLIYLKLYIY